jgi:transcriptional regulator with XRE-family HTH domain
MEFHHMGAYLKQRRIDSGLTQAAVAAELGDLHSQFVSNWERGLCSPPGHGLHKLIDLLKLNREKLVDVMLLDSRAVIESKVYKSKKKSKSSRRAG